MRTIDVVSDAGATASTLTKNNLKRLDNAEWEKAIKYSKQEVTSEYYEEED